jgi:hypothetical protein
MKKQILIVTFFVAALLAGTSNVFGQAVHNSNPRGLSCSDDALHPFAGKTYKYEVLSNATNGNYLWWATKDPNFIVDGALNNSTAFTTNDPTATSDTVGIAWSSEVLANTTYLTNPTFVAVYHSNTDDFCADNLKVFELDPLNGFIVDIMNINDTDVSSGGIGYDALEDQCVSLVDSAWYSGGTMNYNYGKDTLYYEVVAANFSTLYYPQFNISGLDATQTATIEWSYTTDFTTTYSVTAGTLGNDPVETDETNTSNGVSIYVRVIVSNNDYETLTAQTITLTVDGQNSVGDWDVDNWDGTNLICNQTTNADEEDFVEQTINPRPTVTANPSPFSGQSPNDDLVPKN